MTKIRITSLDVYYFEGGTSRVATLVEVRSERLRNLLKEVVRIAGTYKFEYRGHQLEVMGGRDAILVLSRCNCPQLCNSLGVCNRCGSRCPVLRAVQGFFTRCRRLVESAAECSCGIPQEQSGADSGLPSPGMEESMLDKQEGASSDTASRSSEEEEFSSDIGSSELCSEGPMLDKQEGDRASRDTSCLLEEEESSSDMGEACDVEGAAPQAPQSSSSLDDGQIIEEMLEAIEEDNFCPPSSEESRSASEEGPRADAGSPAPTGAGASGEQPSPLGDRPVGAKESGPEESSCDKKAGLDSSPAEGSSGPALDSNGSVSGDGIAAVAEQGSGSLWEMETNPEEDQHAYGGGGAQAHSLSAKEASTSVEKQVTLLLQQFFSEIEDLFQKEEGRDRWDAKKVICSSALAPHELPASKFKRPKSRKLSLWVDISGSVSHLTHFIINLITAACKDKDVQVVIGSEAHPEYVLPDDFVRSGKPWYTYYSSKNNYIRDFDKQVERFLKENPLEEGSTIVIWSDYMSIHADDLPRLARLLKPYKVVWLCSHMGKDRNYSGNESFKLETFARKQGHLFLWGIDSLEGIRKALRELNIRRRKL